MGRNIKPSIRSRLRREKWRSFKGTAKVVGGVLLFLGATAVATHFVPKIANKIQEKKAVKLEKNFQAKPDLTARKFSKKLPEGTGDYLNKLSKKTGISNARIFWTMSNYSMDTVSVKNKINSHNNSLRTEKDPKRLMWFKSEVTRMERILGLLRAAKEVNPAKWNEIYVLIREGTTANEALEKILQSLPPSR
ncbi:MAG: hypothetical protein ABIE23_03560 [archaeon]